MTPMRPGTGKTGPSPKFPGMGPGGPAMMPGGGMPMPGMSQVRGALGSMNPEMSPGMLPPGMSPGGGGMWNPNMSQANATGMAQSGGGMAMGNPGLANLLLQMKSGGMTPKPGMPIPTGTVGSPTMGPRKMINPQMANASAMSGALRRPMGLQY